jgi:hypothetical protein
MHEGVINSRDLIVLFTHDYLQSRYTRKEFTSFEEERQSQEERHIIVLRCERKKDECWAAAITFCVPSIQFIALAVFITIFITICGSKLLRWRARNQDTVGK